MCLDIDPSSVIHEQLEAKIYNLTSYMGGGLHKNYVISKQVPDRDPYYHSTHNLTMLPSFHISIGAPDAETILINKYNSDWEKDISFSDVVPIIGDITLAPVCISEKNNKKSAWIPLNPHWFECLAPPSINKHLNDFDSFDHRCDECPVKHLHVSVANLTGNPHDSIARPEDCIIDTITA
jgi:hypothetical protein